MGQLRTNLFFVISFAITDQLFQGLSFGNYRNPEEDVDTGIGGMLALNSTPPELTPYYGGRRMETGSYSCASGCEQ
jgi:hypothetical protein